MFPTDIRILVVDDMKNMRQLVKGQLKSMGYKNIVEGNNGKVAFDVLEEQNKKGEPVGLILSDWNMPEMTGLEFLQKVRSTDLYKDLPFLMITAEGEQRQVIQAIKAGVSNYVTKPFSPQTFKTKFEAVWKKHNSK